LISLKKRVVKIFFTLILLSLIGCSANKLVKNGVYNELSSREYEELMKQDDINIIDVRTKSEYKKSHIKDAINASFFSGHFLDIIEEYKLDTNKVTLIYCETQHRSPSAAKRLSKVGFKKIVDLKKGMNSWRKQGFPYESEK